MRLRSSLILASVLTLALAGCATPKSGVGAAPPPSVVPTPVVSESPSAVVTSGSTDAQAQAQARAWLAEASLPPGAAQADAGVTSFGSFTGWPCGPVAELHAYWRIPGMGVPEAANWLREHPTGRLITTRHSAVADDPRITSVTVGYIPAQGAQQGIVFTVEKLPDGVAVRAEIAAQTSTASGPPLPGGGQYGAPGQG
ncbi:hypothetical protein [Microbacterium capsulatum]|uniref:Lipoprotein n=1 Tax=Microbacterium capsulatum TaxID=3041921 RepID=A0ABU0XCA0_9MICO|nr:hypothetical protein [Microbacterium sp. ASV81]MDQ4212738.1 hypothetical protein [Microbacterium sp. ASV81]